MIEQHLDNEEIDSIHRALGPDESYDDLVTMGEIIAESRLTRRPISNNKKEATFAFITLCGISWPGKPPNYKAEVTKLRRSFRGISNNDTLKDHFRSRLTESLIGVESYEDLNFHDITSIFHPGFLTSRPAVMKAGAGAGSVYDNEEEESEEDDSTSGSSSSA